MKKNLSSISEIYNKDIFAIARGDKDAFNQFSKAITPYITYLLVNKKGVERNDADDVVQDTLRQVWLKAAQFDSSKASAVTWVLRIACNKACDLARSKRRRRSISLQGFVNRGSEFQDGSDLLCDDSAPTPFVKNAGQDIFDNRVKPVLLGALSKLKDDQRVIIDLIYFKGFTYNQAAQDLNIPMGTLKSRLHGAVSKLRQSLKELAPDLEKHVFELAA